MALSKTEIISNAITLLGNKPILSLEGQGDMVAAAAQAFDMLLPAKLSEGFWRFATTYTMLNQIQDLIIPSQMNWLYAYELPDDYLEMVRLHPQNYNFEIFENNVMYSNVLSPQYIEYVRLVDPDDLPPYFVHYFVYELALYLCLSSATSATYYAALKPERDFTLGLAMAKDAQNRPQSPMASMPVISGRWVSTWANG
jgi:hypothetical protein